MSFPKTPYACFLVEMFCEDREITADSLSRLITHGFSIHHESHRVTELPASQVPPPSRPFLSSIRPDIKDGTKVTLGFCAGCGTVKVFNCTDRHEFADTGYWIECRACAEWRYFFRIDCGRVVNTGHMK